MSGPPVLAFSRPATELIPHRAPWVTIDRVERFGGDEVAASKRVSADDPWVVDGALSAPLVVELLAQTAACFMGAEHAGGASGHRGYLVAARRFQFPSLARVGETLRLAARRDAVLGSMVRFAVRATVDEGAGGERLVAEGELTCAVTFAP